MPRFSLRIAGLGLAVAASLFTSAAAQNFKKPDPWDGLRPEQQKSARDAAIKFAARLFPETVYGPDDKFYMFSGTVEGRPVILVSPDQDRYKWRVAIDPKTWQVVDELFTRRCRRHNNALTCT